MGRKNILPYRWGGSVQLPLKIGAIVMPPQNLLVDKFCTEKSGESVHFLRSSVFWRDENNTPICGGVPKICFLEQLVSFPQRTVLIHSFSRLIHSFHGIERQPAFSSIPHLP
jgi:hypothetical protein